jgi:predicted ATPase
VREYFGDQLRSQRPAAWQEANRRLYHHYRALAPALPETFRAMEPLFSAATYACNAGLFRDALHEVYLPRIQRGDASFAAKVLGARGALLAVLVHFFEDGRWGSPLQTGLEEQRLTEDDQLLILSQAALYLTTTRGMGVSEARICYERVEALCRSVRRPLLHYSALIGQCRYALTSENLTVAMQIARRALAVAQEQNDAALLTGAYNHLACTAYSLGDFGAGRRCAMLGIEAWRGGGMASTVEEVDAPAVSCLFHQALCEWHLGEMTACHATMAESISLAKELKDMPALTNAVFNAGILSHFERNIAEAERLSSEVIELSTRYHFAFWLTIGSILRGWARSASGATAEGIASIEHGIQDYRVSGQVLGMPYFLGLKAEALYLAGRVPEALETIREAETFAERSGARGWCAELYRLRGVFLAATDADETQIEAAFREAIATAQQQKSVSLLKRAETSYAEYRGRQAGH